MESRLDEINKLLKEKNDIMLSELDEVKEITKLQTSFSRNANNLGIHVLYISDLHLDYHLKNNNIDFNDYEKIVKYFDCIIKKMISDNEADFLMHQGVSANKLSELIIEDYSSVRYLYRYLSKEEFGKVEEEIISGAFDKKVAANLKRCFIIDGDVAADINLIKLFFERFVLRLKFYSYKSWKKQYGYIAKHENEIGEQDALVLYENELSKKIEKKRQALNVLKMLEKKIGKNIYKTYAKKYDYDAKRLIQARKEIPDYAYYLLRDVIIAESDVTRFQKGKGEIIKNYIRGYHNEFKGIIEERCPIFYVLGNHEYVDFDTVDEAVNVFTTELAKYGVSVVQNEIIEYGNCVICGGTGFAQYNPEYNSNTLICAKKMMGNREYEIQEGIKFEDKYQEALKIAKDKNVPLLVFSHYSVMDWLNGNTSDMAFYFTGHTHNNDVFVTDKGNIYCDNQVGYTSEDYRLKRYPIGTLYNPFFEYEDGYYEISPQQYADFYLYNGDSVGIGLIEKAIQNKKFYMIKRNGFYGFFLINERRTQICVGGRLKNISEITNIEYFYNCFNLMIYQYVLALKPYRKFQERISSEIGKLNLPFFASGKIHGCIVDVDFYHHIMINPFGDTKITLYYSPVFGLAQSFESFGDMLKSIEEKNPRVLANNQEYLSAKKKMIEDEKNILVNVSNTTMIGEENNKLVVVDTSGGMYSFSNRINQLQRLFSANILREWNNNLISQILEIDDVDEYVINKNLTDYQLVQKHWKNLLKIKSNRINEKMVKCALSNTRKCRFPYLDIEKRHGYYYEINPIGEDEIKEYINHIPKSVLRKTVLQFYVVLNKDIFKCYPLECIDAKDMSIILSHLSGKEVIEILELMPKDWSKTYGKVVAERMNQKNRPAYCSKELWEKIRACN